MQKMSSENTLRTLKDINAFTDKDLNNTYKLCLKQEAIKRAKYFMKKLLNFDKKLMRGKFVEDISIGKYWKGRLDEVMEMYDLTEEDFKNE